MAQYEWLYTEDGTCRGMHEIGSARTYIPARDTTVALMSRWYTPSFYEAVREQQDACRALEEMEDGWFWQRTEDHAQKYYTFAHLSETGQDNPVPVAFTTVA